ncbi:MAG: hypothetical protein COA42_04455 [Alteromonadaceae bacterium]|nr:MAG: hypothetical protein COA42_04455 [Alteromonadaceae bacterium]
MVIKIIILIEFVALLISLGSGLRFLFKDVGVSDSKRAVYALGVRISIAVTMMLTIAFGIHSGQLVNTAPWDQPRAVNQSGS